MCTQEIDHFMRPKWEWLSGWCHLLKPFKNLTLSLFLFSTEKTISSKNASYFSAQWKQVGRAVLAVFVTSLSIPGSHNAQPEVRGIGSSWPRPTRWSGCAQRTESPFEEGWNFWKRVSMLVARGQGYLSRRCPWQKAQSWGAADLACTVPQMESRRDAAAHWPFCTRVLEVLVSSPSQLGPNLLSFVSTSMGSFLGVFQQVPLIYAKDFKSQNQTTVLG